MKMLLKNIIMQKTMSLFEMRNNVALLLTGLIKIVSAFLCWCFFLDFLLEKLQRPASISMDTVVLTEGSLISYTSRSDCEIAKRLLGRLHFETCSERVLAVIGCYCTVLSSRVIVCIAIVLDSKAPHRL
jgi:hypothetical protein